MKKPTLKEFLNGGFTTVCSILNLIAWIFVWRFLIHKYNSTNNGWYGLIMFGCAVLNIFLLAMPMGEEPGGGTNKWYMKIFHGPLTLAVVMGYFSWKLLVYLLMQLGEFLSWPVKLAYWHIKHGRDKPLLPPPKESPLAALKEPLADLEQAMSAQPPAQGAYRNQSAEEALQRLKEAFQRASEK